jgi:hypothetical protein
MKLWIRFGSVVSAAALIISVFHSASAANVFEIKASLKGRVETEDSPGKAKLTSQPIQNAALINAARGRFPTASVPANEVLAAAIDCNSGIGALIVWDTSLQSNLVTVAVLSGPFEGIAAGTEAEFVGAFELQTTGDMLNGITGGFLVWVNSPPSLKRTNRCLTLAPLDCKNGAK